MKMVKRVTLIILCVFSCTLFGCGNTSLNQESNSVERQYAIELTIDNYWKFIDWHQDGVKYYFTGVLQFAYYDNIIVSVKRTFSSKEYTTNTYSETYKIELNAAGSIDYVADEKTFDEVKQLLKVEGYMGSYSDVISVVDITGKVYFSV